VAFTREIYDKYVEVVSRTGQKELTMRRVLDILGEFEASGIIEAHVISRGRYGRTKVVELKTGCNIKGEVEKFLVDV
jgi:cell division control protein 6